MISDTRCWQFGPKRFETGEFPLLMGIVNVTPDSFSDGGEYFSAEAAIARGVALAAAGSDILDVGGESTRPGAGTVSETEEIHRIECVVRELADRVPQPISIDTTKSRVASAAIAAGATIVNDISGLTFDAEMPAICRETGVGVICMHIQGTPRTMQIAPHYQDVVREVREFLKRRLEELDSQGIPPERVVLDPGIGFGKTADHNLQLLSNVAELRSLGRPVLIGHSRKRFISKILGRQVDERTSGTIGVSVALAMQSADLLRVHDVESTRDALLAWHAVASRTAASRSSSHEPYTQ